MDELNELDQQKQNPGLQWAQRLGVGGGIIVLVFTVLSMLMMLSSGGEPIKGYAPPQTDAYYAEHMDELEQELTQQVIPHLEGVTQMEQKDGKLVVHITHEHYIATRAAIMRYFDRDLFVFEQD